MTADVVIRAASQKDIATICALYKELNADHHQHWPLLFPASKALTEDSVYWHEFVANPEAQVFLASIDERIVGMASALIETEQCALLTPIRYCYIDAVVVLQAKRRLGLAQVLMQTIEHWASANNAYDIRLKVWNFNHPATALYEKLGFVERSKNLGKVL